MWNLYPFTVAGSNPSLSLLFFNRFLESLDGPFCFFSLRGDEKGSERVKEMLKVEKLHINFYFYQRVSNQGPAGQDFAKIKLIK